MKARIVLIACAAVGAARSAAAADPGPSSPPPLEQGRAVFQYWCAACHGEGPGHPGTEALAKKYGGTPPALLEARTDLTPELLRFYVRHGVAVMPPFRKTEIGDRDLEALCAYLTRPRASVH